MKIDCGETSGERIKRLESWHPFFPWWPRRVGSHDCRCFEWIERRGMYNPRATSFSPWRWEYRLPYAQRRWE